MGYGALARDLGMAYQITKDVKYATKAKEALLNIHKTTADDKFYKAEGLSYYCLAYDFIQPTLDSANDIIIRDRLATLSDSVYKDLTIDGAHYITFADYHGRAYPALGVAGAALYDYTNPNRLSLSSTPTDWHKVGTDYLFENDVLHSLDTSLLGFAYDDAGKYSAAAYKEYTASDFVLWLQVSRHAHNENLLEIYPLAKKAFTAEVWDSLPNQYSSNYGTGGNMKWIYHTGLISLLPAAEKSQVLNHLDRIEGSSLLPYSDYLGSVGGSHGVPPSVMYSVFENYDSIPRTFPTTTSHLDPNSIFQVFRGNWNNDADWLSLITFNKQTDSNRDMAHHDQMSFEYYSRGDLLLADGGEDKYVLDTNYGMVDTYHNTIAIEDPRTPFPVTPWSGSTSRGMYKGYATGIVTPVTIGPIVQTPWIELMKTQATISNVINSWDDPRSLSSPIQYERTVLYPESDYFIIIDRMEGTQPWVYRNIFRPTSLMISPSTGSIVSQVGHVNGALTIGSTSYNWLALPYKTETNTGISTNALTWTTKNPYGKDVRLNLYSSPSSEILVEKNVGRIGGDDPTNEVFSPIVWFRTPAAAAEYRVTALLSSYTTETAKTATEIPVTGTGHALKVHAPSYDDYIYTGKGTSTFDGLNTDADTAFVRKAGNITDYTLMNGKHLYNAATKKFESSVSLGYITYNNKNTIVSVNVSGSGSSDLYFYGMSTPTYVKMDGTVYGGWSMSDSTTLKISKTSGTHSFEFNGGDGTSIVAPVAAFIGTPLSGTAPLAVTFTDSSTGTSITNRRWDFGDGNISTYTTATNPSHRYANPGTYTVNLTVTNAGGSNSLKRTNYITASVPTVAPVAAFTGTPLSGTAPLAVTFTDSSTGTSITNRRWDFGDGNISTYTTATNPSHRYVNPGTYTVNLTVTNAGGSNSLKRTNYITASVPTVAPVAAFIGTPLSGTAPLAVTFTDSSTGTSITNRRWDFGDGNISTYTTATNPSHRYVNPGTYTVNLTVTNASGSNSLKRTNYITASVPTVAPVAAFIGTPLSGTAPLAVTFTDSSTGTSITNRRWDFGDGNISSYTTATNPSHRYANPGTYTVNLTVTNASGSNSLKRTNYITASVPTVAPVAAFIGTPLSGTAPLDVAFTDSSTGTSITNRRWDFGDGNISTYTTATNPSHRYVNPGTYTVNLTVTNTSGSNSLKRTNYITVPPALVIYTTTQIGVFHNGVWSLDSNGNGVWDAITDKVYNFGVSDSTSVVGDWNGDNKTEIGVYKDGAWYLDYNGDGLFIPATGDKYIPYGAPGWTQIVGDWNGDGKSEIGIYKDAVWYLDYGGSGVIDANTRYYQFGAAGWTPVTGDWDGDKKDEIGVYQDGNWYLDYDGNGFWSSGDKYYGFGTTGWTPVTGKWTSDGFTKIGIYKDGNWYIDYNGDGLFSGIDRYIPYGVTGWTHLVGDWNGG